jgi:phospholipid/cholesterol/gamma-HCH transport system substrate-binding protein
MEKRTSVIRLGIFIVLGVAALVVAVFLVGKEEGLFRETFRLTAYFNTIEGLRTGAAVRLSGVDIGVVDRIAISPQNNKVRVDIKLSANIRNFIKKDSYASIEQEGLVGNKYVGVTVGSASSEEVSDGEVILSREPFRFSAIVEDAQGMIANTRRATDEFTKILSSINRGRGTLGKLITDEDVYEALKRATAQADSSLRKTAEEFSNIPRFISGVSENLYGVTLNLSKMIADVDSTVASARGIIDKVNRGEGTLGALVVERGMYDSLLVIVQNIRVMAEAARSGAERFDEDMEALKHNWFFKGYFEDRGYWDKADFEKELETQTTALKKLQDQIKAESEQLKVREEQLRKREEALEKKEKNQ